MNFEVPEGLGSILAWTMVVYVLLMFAISAFAQRRVSNVEDYVVAGRRLPFVLSTATLLATWFGAGTLMTAADEVRSRGIEAATLDPVGAGICLIMVGFLFAVPLWKEKIVTLPEFFGRRYGSGAEVLASVLMIPPYLGWIAAQFMALASILELFFGIPTEVGVLLVAAVGIGYTLMGGMWAVTLTDAVQMALIIVGLGVVAVKVLWAKGDGSVVDGLGAVWTHAPEGHRVFIPTDSVGKLLGWVGVLCAGALGNIPSQDVMQRVFAARSPEVARAACLTAGGLYLLIGLVPVVLGLAGHMLYGDMEGATLPMLASLFLHPVMAVIFVVTLLSVVLSTIDSALLAPASVLARDLLARVPGTAARPLLMMRLSVAAIGVLSLAMVYAGESAYSLLESGYELGMVSLMAPLALGVWARRHSKAGAIAAMLAGTVVWTAHAALGLEDFMGIEGFPMPTGLVCMALSFLAYPVVVALEPRRVV